MVKLFQLYVWNSNFSLLTLVCHLLERVTGSFKWATFIQFYFPALTNVFFIIKAFNRVRPLLRIPVFFLWSHVKFSNEVNRLWCGGVVDCNWPNLSTVLIQKVLLHRLLFFTTTSFTVNSPKLSRLFFPKLITLHFQCHLPGFFLIGAMYLLKTNM